MKTSELVLNFLREQGFLPQVDESNNIEFKFQMASFVFIENDDDPDFFQLLLPNIYDVTEDNRDIVLETVNKVNQSMKVAKACVVENSVWVFFETILDRTGNDRTKTCSVTITPSSKQQLWAQNEP